MTQFIDWLLGLLTPAQWEAWRNWLATIGGLVALAIALRTYLANARARRFEQPRLVYAKVKRVQTLDPLDKFQVSLRGDDLLFADGDDANVVYHETPDKALEIQALVPMLRVSMVLHNGSRERLGPAYVIPWSRSAEGPLGTAPPIEDVDPDSDVVIEFIKRLPSLGEPTVGVAVTFRDASGKWWTRRLGGAVAPTRPIRDRPSFGMYWRYNKHHVIGTPVTGTYDRFTVATRSRAGRFAAWLGLAKGLSED